MRLRTIEVLRGAAALSVLLAHATSSITANSALGFTSFHGGFEVQGQPGVEFFFVLSGFVMAVVHGNDFGDMRRIPAFLWSRVSRLYPLIWLVTAARIGQYWGRLPFPPESVLGWLTLVGSVPFDVNPVVWTLRIELAFYVLFGLSLVPWVGPVVLAVWCGAVAGAIAGLPVLSWLPPGVAPGFASSVLSFSAEFLCGLLAGALFRRVRLPGAAAAALGAVAITALLWRLTLNRWGADIGPPSHRIQYGLAFGGLILALANLERAGLVRPGRWADAVGAMSYPTYIAHLLFLDCIVDLIASFGWQARAGADAVCAIMVAGALLASAALTYGFDRPVGRWLRALGRSFLAPPRPNPALQPGSAPPGRQTSATQGSAIIR